MISTNKRKKFTKLETDDIDNDNLEEQTEPDDINNVVKTGHCKTITIVVTVLILVLVSSLLGYFIGSSVAVENQSQSNDKDQSTNYHIRNEKECIHKRCCKSIDIGNNSANVDCNDLSIIDCVFEAEYCEWDCDYFQQKKQNASYVPFRNRNRIFAGLSTGIGVYFEEEYTGESIEEDEPNSVNELMERSKMVTIDDCGVMYEEVLEYDIAVEQFAQYQKARLNDFSSTDPDDHNGNGRPRRMQTGQPNGLISSDTQGQTAIAQGNQLTSSDESVVCMTFVSSGQGGGGQGNTNYEYFDHICTGVAISPYYVLTAGHCCHSGILGASFYSSWYVYPKIQWYSDISYSWGYKVQSATIYTQWQSYQNYHYDFCILKLYSPYVGYYIQMRYNIESFINSAQLSTYTDFNTLGYRYDRYSPNYNGGYLVYGWKNRYLRSVSTYSFTFAWDAYYHGFGGAPIIYGPHGHIYCVISQFGWQYNTCARITLLVFTDFCNLIGYNSYCV